MHTLRIGAMLTQPLHFGLLILGVVVGAVKAAASGTVVALGLLFFIFVGFALLLLGGTDAVEALAAWRVIALGVLGGPGLGGCYCISLTPMP